MKKVLLFIFTCNLLLQGAPAFEHLRSYTQKDGSHFKGSPKGDEYLHYIETNSGDIALFNKQSGNYEYAIVAKERGIKKLVPSGIAVSSTKDTKRHINPFGKIDPAELQEIYESAKSHFHGRIPMH